MNLNIGDKVRDKVSGFSGIVTGIVDYISGCKQALVGPKIDKDGKPIDSQWFDVQRLEVLKTNFLKLENAATPGPDREPPKR